MPLAACARCGKMFSKTESDVCPACAPDEEEDYEKVRETLEKQPNLSAEDVSDATEVDLQCVMRMIEQGRIQNVSTLEPVKCGRCGAPAISLSKKLCEACLNELNTQLAKEQGSIRLPKKKEVELGKALNVSNVKSAVDKKSRGHRLREK